MGCVSCGVWERAGIARSPGGKLCVEESSVWPQNGIQMLRGGGAWGRGGPEGRVQPMALGSVLPLASYVTSGKGPALPTLLGLSFWDRSPVPWIVIVNGD